MEPNPHLPRLTTSAEGLLDFCIRCKQSYEFEFPVQCNTCGFVFNEFCRNCHPTCGDCGYPTCDNCLHEVDPETGNWTCIYCEDGRAKHIRRLR